MGYGVSLGKKQIRKSDGRSKVEQKSRTRNDSKIE
jgi:hypothetical protein